jgi:hypothetical protein
MREKQIGAPAAIAYLRVASEFKTAIPISFCILSIESYVGKRQGFGHTFELAIEAVPSFGCLTFIPGLNRNDSLLPNKSVRLPNMRKCHCFC